MASKLLVVERDAKYGEWLRQHLGVLYPDAAVDVLHLPDLERLPEIPTANDCDILVLSAPFGSSPEDPAALGLDLLRDLRKPTSSHAIIVIAEDGNELTAVRALQLGAVDYIPKRLLTPERMRTAVRVALRRLEKRAARRTALMARNETKSAQVGAVRADGLLSAADGSAVASAGPLLATDFVPGYTIRAVIGDSEKAAVYLATSARLGRNVALKVSKTVRDDPAERQFLEHEYTAIAAIRDPSVVQLYDYGVHQGREYLAMEYIPRGDLKARLQKGLTESQALRYVEQIANALKVVHQAGLLHRDLKPANVMLRENGEVALIDFGLARALDGSTQSTRSGVLRGSPYYMSPEQALGEQLDARTDFYSLGVILFEMLSGRRPFTGSSALDVLQQHVNAAPPALPPTLAHLQPLLGKLLAKSRDERFATAQEVAQAVAAARLAVMAQPRSSAA